MKTPDFEAENELMAPLMPDDGGEIEKISDRLTTLAHKINDYNANRRGNMPVGDLLPSFLTSLSKKPDVGRRAEIAASRRLPQASQIDGAAVPPAFEIEPGDRIWPVLAKPDSAELRALENKIHEQAAELSRRHSEIADLTNLNQTQANELATAFGQIDRLGEAMDELRRQVADRNSLADELRRCHTQIGELTSARQTQANEMALAREQIDRLDKALVEVQQMAAERENDVTETARKLIQSETEKVALKVQLGDERKQVNHLSLRLLNLEGTLNDRTTDLATSRETIEALMTELASVKAAADRRHTDTLKQLRADFEKRVEDFHSRIDGRDRIIKNLEKSNFALACCCDELSKKASEISALQQHTCNTIEAQVDYIEFLETVTTVERENAEATIKELIAQFQSEREELLARENASAEIRKNIIQLLPVLAARRNAAAEAKVEAQEEVQEVAQVEADAPPDMIQSRVA
jgi:chromosome segregation ATPase